MALSGASRRYSARLVSSRPLLLSVSMQMSCRSSPASAAHHRRTKVDVHLSIMGPSSETSTLEKVNVAYPDRSWSSRTRELQASHAESTPVKRSARPIFSKDDCLTAIQ
jgi:hypothetical protein